MSEHSGFTLRLTPENAAELAATLRPLGGRVTRWTVIADGRRREVVGRVARPVEWPSSDDPCLLVPPGQTNQTNVLAFIALHIRWRGASAFLAKRRSYEVEPLEWEPLGDGPLSLTVELMPE